MAEPDPTPARGPYPHPPAIGTSALYARAFLPGSSLHPMFGRKAKSGQPPSPPESPGPGLRSMIMDLDPGSLGLTPDTSGPVWGVVMDTGLPDGRWYCLATLADGSTSLYTSSNSGVIGAGAHETVRAASQALLSVVTEHLDLFVASTDRAIPASGMVAIRALTFDGQRVYAGRAQDLENGTDAGATIFFAVHNVITQVRMIVETQDPK
jgi:hypothetical protein